MLLLRGIGGCYYLLSFRKWWCSVSCAKGDWRGSTEALFLNSRGFNQLLSLRHFQVISLSSETPCAKTTAAEVTDSNASPVGPRDWFAISMSKHLSSDWHTLLDPLPWNFTVFIHNTALPAFPQKCYQVLRWEMGRTDFPEYWSLLASTHDPIQEAFPNMSRKDRSHLRGLYPSLSWYFPSFVSFEFCPLTGKLATEHNTALLTPLLFLVKWAFSFVRFHEETQEACCTCWVRCQLGVFGWLIWWLSLKVSLRCLSGMKPLRIRFSNKGRD